MKLILFSLMLIASLLFNRVAMADNDYVFEYSIGDPQQLVVRQSMLPDKIVLYIGGTDSEKVLVKDLNIYCDDSKENKSGKIVSPGVFEFDKVYPCAWLVSSTFSGQISHELPVPHID